MSVCAKLLELHWAKLFTHKNILLLCCWSGLVARQFSNFTRLTASRTRSRSESRLIRLQSSLCNKFRIWPQHLRRCLACSCSCSSSSVCLALKAAPWPCVSVCPCVRVRVCVSSRQWLPLKLPPLTFQIVHIRIRIRRCTTLSAKNMPSPRHIKRQKC